MTYIYRSSEKMAGVFTKNVLGFLTLDRLRTSINPGSNDETGDGRRGGNGDSNGNESVKGNELNK